MTDASSDSNATSSGDSAASNQTALANLALANEIFNTNLAQQNAIQHQQAIFYRQLATVAKSIEMVMSIDPKDPGAADKLKMCRDLIESFRVSQS